MSTVVWWTEESAGYTLSVGGTRATSDASTRAVLLARRGLVSGMWYWETEYTNVGATNTSMSLSYGFAQVSVSKTNVPGAVDAFGWSNDINGTGRVHNSDNQASSAVAFSTRPRMIVRHWFNADTGQYQVSYSDDGTTITVHGWRDLGYHTATHSGSSWDTSKVWYPAYSVNTANEIIDVLSTASQCYFSPPAGAKFLGEAPLVVYPKGVSDAEFEAWLKTDADRVMLIEAEYSTGEPDLLGLTGDGSTEQEDGITLLNDVSNQPGNSAYAAGYTNATIAFGERKYWEVRPTYIPTTEDVWIGFKIKNAIDATVIAGAEIDELGINPDGTKWISGTEVNCFCPCANTILSLNPDALFLFDEEGVTGVPWTPAEITTRGWYDADDGATLAESGGAVATWFDKSGNNYNANQATESKKPTLTLAGLNSKNYLDFDGTSDALNIATGNAFGQNLGKAMIYIVCKPDSVSGERYAFTISTGTVVQNVRFLIGVNASKWRVGGRRLDSDSFQSNENQTATVSNWVILGALYDYSTATLSINLNGTQVQTSSFQTAGTSSNTSSRGGRIGCIAIPPNDERYFDGGIAEIIAVDESFSNAEKIEGYLAHKWGLQANLPLAHPYKTSPPVI